jgi:hypothetical protein
LYPNEKLQRVGPEAAQADVDACIALAGQYGLGPERGKRVAAGTAETAAVGSATGAAVGAVTGSVGRGAAAGAAGGAAGGLMRGILRSRDPNPVYARFVERCLKERGLETIGWH